MSRLSLNSLSSEDNDSFVALCRLAGLGGRDLDRVRRRSGGELRDLLVMLFESEQIQKVK